MISVGSKFTTFAIDSTSLLFVLYLLSKFIDTIQY